jgi:plastocyanin
MLEQAQLRVPAVAIGALALALGGCGGSSYDKSGGKSSTAKSSTAGATTGAGQTLKLKADADGGLYFEPKKLSAKAGSVTLDMTNPKSTKLEHGIAVKGNGVDQDGAVVEAGGTTKVTATLKPGTYEFYCNYENHEQRGMKGTLTVQ